MIRSIMTPERPTLIPCAPIPKITGRESLAARTRGVGHSPEIQGRQFIGQAGDKAAETSPRLPGPGRRVEPDL